MLLPAMAGLIAFSGILCYLDVELKVITLRSTTVMHSILGFVISLLLVFRTNTAYDRWWDGRKMWGELVNNSRNLMMKINAYLPAEERELKNDFRILVSNFAFALKGHLRGQVKVEELEEHPRLPATDFKLVDHIPNKIALQLYCEVDKMVKQQLISEERLLSLNEELRSFTNIAGACERIKKTPIPYSYSSFIKRIIFIYVITLPIGLIHDMKWATIPIVLFIFYAFASLELLAEEIEDPFGTERNDLPIDELAHTIRKNLKEIVG